MTAMQKVAMGLLIVTLTARFGAWDALPDVVGWVLVGWGVHQVRDRLTGTRLLLGLAVLAGVIAVPLYLPALLDRLDDSTQWFLSLPQSVFEVLLCRAIAEAGRRAEEPDRWPLVVLENLAWVFVVVTVGPALVYGGGLTALATPLAVVAVVAALVLVYYLFRVSRRPWLLPA